MNFMAAATIFTICALSGFLFQAGQCVNTQHQRSLGHEAAWAAIDDIATEFGAKPLADVKNRHDNEPILHQSNEPWAQDLSVRIDWLGDQRSQAGPFRLVATWRNSQGIWERLAVRPNWTAEVPRDQTITARLD